MHTRFRGFAFVGLILLSIATTSRAALFPGLFVPRNGLYQYDSSSTLTTVQLLTTDSDELLRTATAQVVPPATTIGSFAIRTPSSTKFLGAATLRLNGEAVIPFSGTVITDTAPDLDAFAFGISDGTSLLAFFQMRIAGSNATVADTSLAAQAVSAGLWTNVNAYFEFPSFHAGIGPVSSGVQPTGPASYQSFPIPEPTSLALLTSFAAVTATRRRRSTR